jgi:hypothetical protein
MNGDTSGQDEDDKDFEQALSSLYRAALLDEDFQQQVGKDLHTLPETARASLKPKEQVFVDGCKLSAEARARLQDRMVLTTEADRPVKPPKPAKASWWKRLLGGGSWERSFLPGPAFSIPAALSLGLMLGVLLPTLLSFMETPGFNGRGAVRQMDVQLPAGQEPGAAVSDEARAKRQLRLDAIAGLFREGKVTEGEAEVQAFRRDYPDYQEGQ